MTSLSTLGSFQTALLTASFLPWLGAQGLPFWGSSFPSHSTYTREAPLPLLLEGQVNEHHGVGMRKNFIGHVETRWIHDLKARAWTGDSM